MALLLSLVALFVLAPVARAQEGAPDAPPPVTQPEPPQEPEVIPVPEIIDAAGQIERTLRQIEQSAAPTPEISALIEGLAERRERIRSRADTARERLAAAARLSELEDVESDWTRTRDALAKDGERVVARARALENQLARLDDERDLWGRTREAAREADVPDAVRQGIGQAEREIARVRRAVAVRRDQVLELQAGLSDLGAITDDVLTQTGAARDQIRSEMLVLEDVPLWTALAELDLGEERRADILANVWSDLAVTGEFIADRRIGIALHLLIIALSMYAMITLRSRAAGWAREDETFVVPAHLLERPYASAILIGYALTPVLYPAAPTVVYGALGIVGLVPTLLLLPQILPRTWQPLIRALAVLFVLDRLRDLVDVIPLLERTLYVLELGAALFIFARLQRTSDLGSALEHEALRRSVKVGLRAITGAVVVALGASVVGASELGHVLGEGTLETTYLCVAVFAGHQVLSGILGVTLRSRAAATLASLREHQGPAIARARSLARIGAILAIAFFALGSFGVRDDLVSFVGGILATPLGASDDGITLGQALQAVATFVLAIYLSRSLRFLLEHDVLPRLPLARGVPYTISASTHYLIVFIGFVAAISTLGLDLTRFTVLAGALGVGVGFGLQTIVQNFVSGLILLFERPIQVGDTVEVHELIGQVTRIGIRSSTVRTTDGAEVIVPNASLIAERVVNWTLSDRQRRIVLRVGVAYGSDTDRTIAVLLEVAKSHADIVPDPAPQALLTAFGESSLDFELRAWTHRYEDWKAIASDLALGINRELAAAGIEIPFPQRDLHIRTTGPVATTPTGSAGGPAGSTRADENRS